MNRMEEVLGFQVTERNFLPLMLCCRRLTLISWKSVRQLHKKPVNVLM